MSHRFSSVAAFPYTTGRLSVICRARGPFYEMEGACWKGVTADFSIGCVCYGTWLGLSWRGGFMDIVINSKADAVFVCVPLSHL